MQYDFNLVLCISNEFLQKRIELNQKTSFETGNEIERLLREEENQRFCKQNRYLKLALMYFKIKKEGGVRKKNTIRTEGYRARKGH